MKQTHFVAYFILNVLLFGTVSCDKGEIFQYKTDTFIKDWLLCGPFPNCENCSSTDFLHGENCQSFYIDYLESIGGEMLTIPKAGKTIDFPGLKFNLTWISYKNDTDKIPLNDILSPNDMVVAYAFCRIKSLEHQETILALGSNDGIQVFLNGKKIH